MINAFVLTSDDKRVKVSTDDSTPKFLEDKIGVGSQKLTQVTTNPGADEKVVLDVDETFIDHDLLLNFEVDEHRQHDDAQTTTTTLWSSQKTQDELDLKINIINPVADNRLTKTVGLTGIDVEQTGITVDDTNNVTGINDLTVTGDLTVNGTTTSVNSTTLEVTDANITINNGGTEASADLGTSGLTVEMSDATDVVIGFDSTLTSKMKVGEAGDEREILTATHTQSITNKTIDADNNTISNLAHGAEVDDPSSGVHGVTGNIVGHTDTQTLTNKSIDADNNTISNIEVDNLKAGVLDIDLNAVSASDDTLASAKAIKAYVDQEIQTKDQAIEISYDNATSGLTATNVQTAIDEVEGRSDNADAHIAASSGVHGLTGNVVGDTDSQTLTNKTIDSDSNTITNIVDADIKATAAIDATKLADGTVTNTELQHINSVTSNVQDQLDTKPTRSTGDINETSFAGADSAANATVTGLAFANGTVRSFKAHVSVVVDATADLYEVIELQGIQRGADWVLSQNGTGDNSGVTFEINASGQVQYSSSTYAGFVSLDIDFRAITTSV